MKTDNPRPVLVIAGPTASGKTAVSLELAKRMPVEVISADARQVYRGLDIGTAKPTKAEQAVCKHHCIDILDPSEPYSAADYARDARAALDAIPLTSLPVFVGGSGLYIQAALDGFSHDTAPVEPALREELRRELDLRGREAMWSELNAKDSRAAERYADRNPRRVLRALEFIRSTGRRFSDTWDAARDAAPAEVLYIALSPQRDVLIERIDQRCELMFAQGLVDETRRVLDQGIDPRAQSLRTVGYAEVIDHLAGHSTLREALELTMMNTRRYAKRQRTWFRRDDRFTWIENDPGSAGETLSTILEVMRHHASFAGFVDSPAA